MADIFYLALGLALALGWPLVIFMSCVWNRKTTWLGPVLQPVGRVLYSACGIDP